jgi:hypothetical protein
VIVCFSRVTVDGAPVAKHVGVNTHHKVCQQYLTQILVNTTILTIMCLLLTNQHNIKLHVSTHLSHCQVFVLEPYITDEACQFRDPKRFTVFSCGQILI